MFSVNYRTTDVRHSGCPLAQSYPQSASRFSLSDELRTCGLAVCQPPKKLSALWTSIHLRFLFHCSASPTSPIQHRKWRNKLICRSRSQKVGTTDGFLDSPLGKTIACYTKQTKISTFEPRTGEAGLGKRYSTCKSPDMNSLSRWVLARNRTKSLPHLEEQLADRPSLDV